MLFNVYNAYEGGMRGGHAGNGVDGWIVNAYIYQ
jgi:hypothetical protein